MMQQSHRIFTSIAFALFSAAAANAQLLPEYEALPSEDIIPTVKWQSPVRTKAGELPSSVDNSKLKYFPPIISQQGGSCAQASYIGYMFTYEINSLLDRDASDSDNRFSYFYTWNFINGGVDEGSIGTDGLNIALANGVITENDFPDQYSASQFKWASGYEKYLKGIHYRVNRYVIITASSEAGILEAKQYLYNKGVDGSVGGLLTFGAQSSGWTFDNYYSGPSETGYKSLLKTLATSGSHAMTIVGYDDTVEFTTPDGDVSQGAFIVANTWGSYYHDNGRYYLPYWFFLNRTGESLRADLTGTEVEYRDPKIVFKVGVEYSSRDDLAFRFGVAANGTDRIPLHNYEVPVANNQGGDYPMQGRYGDNDIEFGFDFSSYVLRLDGMAAPKFFLTVVRSGRGSVTGEGVMRSFEVYDYRQSQKTPTVYKCEGIDGKTIEMGENLFGIATVEPKKTSYSPVRWLGNSGQPLSSSFIIRTADGKYAKIRFSDYDRSEGTIKIKYVYAPGGSTNLKQ